MQPQKFRKKIQCPVCNTFNKGILFEINETTKGEITGWCKRCKSYSTYNADTNTYSKSERGEYVHN